MAIKWRLKFESERRRDSEVFTDTRYSEPMDRLAHAYSYLEMAFAHIKDRDSYYTILYDREVSVFPLSDIKSVSIERIDTNA